MVSVSPSLSVRTSLVWQWAQVAVAHESEAHAARARGVIDDEEMRATMVCVAAVAFALDGLYAELLAERVVPDDVVAAWKRNHTARWRRIFETARLAFELSPSLFGEMKWLSSREELGRDFLVHPDALFRDTEDHPLLPNTTAERARLRAEAATRAVELLFAVLEAATSAARPSAADWAARNTGVINQVRARRAELRPQTTEASP